MTSGDAAKHAARHPQGIENTVLMMPVTRVTPLSSLGLRKKKKERTEKGGTSEQVQKQARNNAESVSPASPRHQPCIFNWLEVTCRLGAVSSGRHPALSWPWP
jgi:hypothetical protein